MSEEKFNENVEPYIPFYHRPPNKFIRYYERPLDHTRNGGYEGIERVAVFLNKKKNEEEMVAQVIWKDAF